MNAGNQGLVQPGATVTIVRRKGEATAVAPGMVTVAGSESCLIGVRLAGIPRYASGEETTIVNDHEGRQWAVEALFTGADGITAYFRTLTAWYRLERRSSPRYRTHITVTVVSQSDAYLERGTALDMSEGGLRVLVPEEPMRSRTVDVVFPYRDDSLSLPCHVVRTTICDQGVELHLAFRELTHWQADFVHKRIKALSIITEEGRDLLAQDHDATGRGSVRRPLAAG
jgi:hypothetical protein